MLAQPLETLLDTELGSKSVHLSVLSLELLSGSESEQG